MSYKSPLDGIQRSPLENSLAYEPNAHISCDVPGEIILRRLYEINTFFYRAADERTKRLWQISEERMNRKATPEEIRLILGRDYL